MGGAPGRLCLAEENRQRQQQVLRLRRRMTSRKGEMTTEKGEWLSDQRRVCTYCVPSASFGALRREISGRICERERLRWTGCCSAAEKSIPQGLKPRYTCVRRDPRLKPWAT